MYEITQSIVGNDPIVRKNPMGKLAQGRSAGDDKLRLFFSAVTEFIAAEPKKTGGLTFIVLCHFKG